MILSVLTVPIGVGLLDFDTIKDAFGDKPNMLARWTLASALLLIIMPALVWGVRYLLRRPWRLAFKRSEGGILTKAFWEIVDEEGSPTAALRLFTNRSVKRTNTRTFRAGEPSSLEFGRVFQDIMREASHESQRLVILIDNLDRIAEAEALQMWATIRSFFLASHETEDFKHEPFHPTVILPIDRYAIEQMFAGSEATKGRDRASSFMDKTFDVTFEVTEPVSSDWRAFLESQMEYIFGEAYEPQWGFWTRRLFEQELPSSQTVVTPREINKLLNRIAALYMQWRPGGISVEVMALFVIKRNAIDKGLLEFLQSAAIEIVRVSPDWKRQLAALYYGVELEKATQVLLEQPVRTAIYNFDRERFLGLVSIPGFGEIFEFVTTNLLPPSIGQPKRFLIVSNAALLLDTIPANGDEWVAAAWHNLVELYLESDGPDAATEDVPARIKSLADHVTQTQEASFVSLSAAGISALLSAPQDRWQLSHAINTAGAQLVNFAIQRGIEKPIFPLELDPAPFISKFGALADWSTLWPQLRTTHESDVLTEALNTMLQSKDLQDAVPSAVPLLYASAGQKVYAGSEVIDWESVADVAGNIIRSPQTLGVSAYPPIRALASIANIESPGRNLLITIIDEGALSARLGEANQQKAWRDVADIVALLLWRGVKFSAPDGVRWSKFAEDNPEYNKQIIRSLRKYFPRLTVDILWRSHAVNLSATREFIETLIGHLVETGNLGPFDSQHVFSNLLAYKLAVPWRLREKFLRLVEKQADFLSEMETAPLGPQIIEAAGFLKRKGGREAERAVAIVRQRVEDASVEAWLDAILAGKEPYSMSMGFMDAGEVPFARKSALFEALDNSIGAMTKDAGREIRSRWFSLSNLLRPRARKDVFRKLALALRGAESEQALHLLKAGGVQFLKFGGFNIDATDAVNNVVLVQLQKRDGRDWLKENEAEIHGWIQRAGDADRFAVRDALLVLHRSKIEERRYSADLLLSQWGFDRSI